MNNLFHELAKACIAADFKRQWEVIAGALAELERSREFAIELERKYQL